MSLSARRGGASALAAVVCALAAFPAAAADNTDGVDGQWYVEPYGITDFHAEGIDGTGVKVAVIDGAINLDVPQLSDADIVVHEPSYCFNEDGSSNSAVSDDPLFAWHGTNVVSYLAGNGTGYDGATGITGIAPGATILFYSEGTAEFEDCYSPDGLPDQAGTWSMSQAIIQAVDDGASIISISSGSMDTVVKDALIYAYQHDVIVVASLDNPDSAATVWSSISPASDNGVVSVGSFGPGGKIATDYTGADHWDNATDVVAPGVQLLLQGSETDWHDYHIGRGNSFATPIVAGDLALLLQKYPDATGNQAIQSLIRNTGSEAHELGWDSTWGFGIADTISLLAANPTQYEDVNPLLLEELDATQTGPTVEEVFGTTASPSATASDDATPAPTTDDAEGSSPLPWILIAGGIVVLLLIGAGITTAIVLTRRNHTTH